MLGEATTAMPVVGVARQLEDKLSRTQKISLNHCETGDAGSLVIGSLWAGRAK